MIKVSNVTRRPQVFNLPHDVVCRENCVCADHTHRQVSHNTETGEIGYRLLDRKLSGSVHIQPGTSAELPDVAAGAPEIVRAKARREITVEQVNAPAKAAPKV